MAPDQSNNPGQIPGADPNMGQFGAPQTPTMPQEPTMPHAPIEQQASLGQQPQVGTQTPFAAQPFQAPTVLQPQTPVQPTHNAQPLDPAQPQDIPQPATGLMPTQPPVAPAQTPPQQFSNPFVNPPFGAGTAGVTGPTIGDQPPLSPTNGQPIKPMQAQTPKPPRNHLVYILGGLFALLIVACLAYAFLIFIPNQPQNVWKTGLNRSSKAIDALVTKGTEKSSLEAFKKSEMTASVEVMANNVTFNGDINAKFDSANAAGDIKVTTKQNGQADKVFTTKFLSHLNEGAQFPNIYLQFAGLKSLGLDQFAPALLAYESKWITIDETYLKSLGITEQQAKDSKDNQVTSDDVTEAIRTLSSLSTQYLFTADRKTAVFEQKQYVGKEKVDNKMAYHYVVGINKQHAKDACSAVVNKMTQTQLYKKLNPNAEAKQTESLISDCQKSIDETKDTDTFDMWIDAKYKLIYKIRLTDDKDKTAYMDIGQNYSGGDEVSFFVHYRSEEAKSDIKFSMTTNLKTSVSKAAMAAIDTSDSPYKLRMTLEAKPYSGEIKTDAPAGSIPIQEVLQKLGLNTGLLGGSDTTPKNINDQERANDIKQLHGQIEAYYAGNGRYPTLANLNDTKWLKANLSGLDVQALKDPENGSSRLVATPTAKTYAYEPKASDGSACDNVKKQCDTYVLTATFSDGTTYVKTALN